VKRNTRNDITSLDRFEMGIVIGTGSYAVVREAKDK